MLKFDVSNSLQVMIAHSFNFGFGSLSGFGRKVEKESVNKAFCY